jgi:hypothetical protein
MHADDRLAEHDADEQVEDEAGKAEPHAEPDGYDGCDEDQRAHEKEDVERLDVQQSPLPRPGEATILTEQSGGSVHAQTELMTAMARPLHRLIEADDDASEALAASNRRLEEYGSDTPTQEPAWPTVQLV